MNIKYEKITSAAREKINSFLIEHWYTTKMVVRKKEFDLSKAEGITAIDNQKIVGLLTYIIRGEVCEIMSLDSITENKGIGSELINEAKKAAKAAECEKLVLITTNDNINAIKFYQKRGFSMSNLFLNNVDAARKIKPEIPLVGDFGIKIEHEIEFTMEL